MSAQDDPDSASAVTPSLLSNHSPATARALDSHRCGQTARAARGAQLAGRPGATGLALAAAAWAATVAALIVGSHQGRGAAVQIIFAATMSTAAMGETLLSPALPVISDDQAPPAASGRYHRLGRLALVTGCILGPPVAGAALGADWGTTLLTILAVACAVASIAAHRLGRQLAPGASRLPGGARTRLRTTAPPGQGGASCRSSRRSARPRPGWAAAPSPCPPHASARVPVIPDRRPHAVRPRPTVLTSYCLPSGSESAAAIRRPIVCSHEPACPSAGDTARAAAHVTAGHPEQGWSLLCNGIVLFDDGGLLLPDGRAEAPHTRLFPTIAA